MTELLHEPMGPCCVLPLNKFYEEYQANGTVSWDVYQKNPVLNQKKVLILYNNDFFYGTIRIVTPMGVKLIENITMNPNNGDGTNNNFVPSLSRNKHLYKGNAYRLGFFAAISIEADRVVIDLNQKKIEQSGRFNLIQRFYSHIELADQPFIPKEGPADFGNKILSGRFSGVMNGVLGLSSHQGIHGNNNFMIRLSNIVIKDFEVAGISLNGAQNIEIRNVDINGTNNKVQILGIYSVAVQLRQFLISAIANATLPEARADLIAKRNALVKSIELVAEDIRKTGKIDPNRKLTKIYINDTGFPDGAAAYGIMIHGVGAGVNSFSTNVPSTYISANITIEDTKINNIIAQPREIIALSLGNQKGPKLTYTGNAQLDTAGALFDIIKVLGRDGLYKPNVVSEAQIALARWSDAYLTGTDPALVALRKEGRFGTLSIHPVVVAWSTIGVTYKKITVESKFTDVMKVGNFRFLGNGDTMFHVMKGTFGIRIDSVLNTYIRADITNIKNRGKRGSDICGKYSGPSDGGHPKQGTMIGFTGADSYSMIITASELVKIQNSSATDIHSFNGSSQGIQFNNYTKDVMVEDIIIEKINTDAPIFPFLPNKISPAYGIYVDKTVVNFVDTRTKIQDVNSLTADYLSHKWFINKNITHLE
jgi:hypothetical protein